MAFSESFHCGVFSSDALNASLTFESDHHDDSIVEKGMDFQVCDPFSLSLFSSVCNISIDDYFDV